MKKLTAKLFVLIVAGIMSVGLNNADAGPKGPTIVDVAVAINSDGPYTNAFDTLIAAVGAADPVIAEILTGNGQHTVFCTYDRRL